MRKPLTPEQKARRAEYLKAWRAANPEKTRAQEQRYRELHPERVQAINRRTRDRLGPGYWYDWQQARKAALIAIYGGKCVCCGETELTFLTIDHINGGGRQERLARGNSVIFRELLSAGSPQAGFRCLCMNCQLGYMHGRTCPHQAAMT